MNVGKPDCVWCGGKGFLLHGAALFKRVLTSFYDPCVCLQEATMAIIDPSELDRLTALAEGRLRALERMAGVTLALGQRICELEEQLAKAHKCATCGEPLSHDCPSCKSVWES